MNKLALPDRLADMINVRRTCVFSPGMMPAVFNSTAWAENVSFVPDPSPNMSVADFVFGFIAIGLLSVPIQVGDFGTAICVVYGPLPSRWTDRMLALHHTFVSRFGEVREFFGDAYSELVLALAAIDDAEPIQRFGTPCKALLALTLVPDMRRGSSTAGIRDRALFAEPKAPEREIDEAATAALSYVASELREAAR